MGKATRRKAMEEEARRPDYSSMLLKAKAEQSKKQNDIRSFNPLTAIRGYEGHAIKPLDEFTPRTRSLNTSTRVRELVRYAYNKYNPPAFLYQVWDPEFNTDLKIFPNIKEDFKLWFIAAAQGKSLYKEHTMGLMTKKETHHFTTCPYTFTLREAVWYSVIRGMDETASPSLARKIASTKLSNELINDFWRSVARWFTTHSTTIKQMNDLIDYIRMRHTENADWYLSNDITLNNLIRHMDSWHRETWRVGRMSRHYTKWDGIPVADSEVERGQGNKLVRWKFHQITTGKELAEEGNKQHHCVSSYGSQCSNGTCSIWSLVQYDIFNAKTRSLTIEVRGNEIVQARGYANRSPKADELSVLKEWAAKTGFRFRGV